MAVVLCNSSTPEARTRRREQKLESLEFALFLSSSRLSVQGKNQNEEKTRSFIPCCWSRTRQCWSRTTAFYKSQTGVPDGRRRDWSSALHCHWRPSLQKMRSDSILHRALFRLECIHGEWHFLRVELSCTLQSAMVTHRTKQNGEYIDRIIPENMSSLRLMTLDALLMPPLVMWNIRSNMSGCP